MLTGVFVQLLHSIICLQGFDNRSRFFFLFASAISAFILFSYVFSAYLIISLVILIALSCILSLSTIRRLRDAKLNNNWQFVPGGTFLVTGVIILLLTNNVSYWLLLLPCISCALLLTYRSKNSLTNEKTENKVYILGYHGPVDLSSYLQAIKQSELHSRQRIEPTITEQSSIQQNNEKKVEVKYIDPLNYEVPKKTTQVQEQEQADIGELIRLKLLNNKQFQLSLLIVIVIIFIAVLASSILSISDTPSPDKEQVLVLEETTSSNHTSTTGELINFDRIKHHQLSMPDNFDLFLSKYQGVIIHWQADEVSNGSLWSQTSSQGDKSCKVISFNKGKDIRTLTVQVESNSDYFAYFSPLDSKELIRALAFRGNFSLCGYNFSLKGSQAVLGKNNQYANFMR